MNRFYITKRDIRFFFLGIIVLILISSVLDWEGCKKNAEEGFKAGFEYGLRK